MPALQEECHGLGPYTWTFGPEGRHINAGLEWQISKPNADFPCRDQTQDGLWPH